MSIGCLAAGEIEAAVLAQVHKALQQPEIIVGIWQAGMALRERQELDEPTVLVAMRQMGTMWDNLFPQEQHRIMGLLIERVQFHEDGLDIVWRDDSWQRSAGSWQRTRSWSNSESVSASSAPVTKWKPRDGHTNRPAPPVRDDGALSHIRAAGDHTPAS